MTNQSEVDDFFLKRRKSALHCIINNAYSGGSGTIESSKPQEYYESFDVGVISAHRVLVASLPVLKKSVKDLGYASVINVASMYGIVSQTCETTATYGRQIHRFTVQQRQLSNNGPVTLPVNSVQ